VLALPPWERRIEVQPNSRHRQARSAVFTIGKEILVEILAIDRNVLEGLRGDTGPPRRWVRKSLRVSRIAHVQLIGARIEMTLLAQHDDSRGVDVFPSIEAIYRSRRSIGTGVERTDSCFEECRRKNRVRIQEQKVFGMETRA
jgi:hypothetical protein